MPKVPTGYDDLDKALGPDKPMNGKTVTIQTQWTGGEGTNFAAAVKDFTAATGITVKNEGISSSHEAILLTRIKGNAPPDLAVLAQPTAVVAYGDDNKLVDLASFMSAEKLNDRAPGHDRSGHARAVTSGASHTRPT